MVGRRLISTRARTILNSSLSALLFATLALTGCGFGPAAGFAPITGGTINGQAIGGANPIVGATVKIYATGNSSGVSTGYGVGTLLQEANQQGASAGQDTDTHGNFTFAGGYNCPAGQFVYITIAGGNTGANTTNANSLLVAALGRCEDLYAYVAGSYTGYIGPTIHVNELTTIAAAYALGHFSTVTGSGTGGSTVVGIGAPATNNAAQVSGVSTGCVAGTGSCTTTAAAGLAHAFLNAANLVNVFVGATNTILPGDSSAVVPRQLINSIGNTLSACVNSSGGVAGGSGACASIFSATTIGSNVPADTFSAMVNLAANPTLSGSTTAVTNFYSIATAATSVYSPSITNDYGLRDFTVAIYYPSGLGEAETVATATCATPICLGLVSPYSAALDINDVLYVGNSSNGIGISLMAFASNGTVLGETTLNSALVNAYGLSVDALGNGYIGNGNRLQENDTAQTNSIGVFATGGGALSQFTAYPVNTSNPVNVFATAVDQHNNVWVFGPSSGSTLYSSPAGGTSFTAQANLSTADIGAGSLPGFAIDPDQNIWTSSYQLLEVLTNVGTLSTPAYSNITGVASVISGDSWGITFTGSPYVAYVSSNTYAAPGIQPYTPTLNNSGAGPEITALSAGTVNNASGAITGPYFNEADGAGTIWIADYVPIEHPLYGNAVVQFNPATSTGYRLQACDYDANFGGCFFGGLTPFPMDYITAPTAVYIDSTGSMWVTMLNSGQGNLVQIIGTAAPTWPLLSLGKTGTP